MENYRDGLEQRRQIRNNYENRSNDIQAPRLMGAQPEGKKNDSEKSHCKAAEPVSRNAMADSLMDDISLFVEENTEAEILDEEREIR